MPSNYERDYAGVVFILKEMGDCGLRTANALIKDEKTSRLVELGSKCVACLCGSLLVLAHAIHESKR